MDVARRQQFRATRLEPAVAGIALTLRAIPVTARIIGEDALSAARASVDMSAESGGPAVENRIECLPVLPLEIHPGAIQKRRPGGADHVGHLQRRPVHPPYVVGSSSSGSASSGLAVACRWRCERCRYTVVAFRSLWPSKSWMVRRSTPASSRCVAKEWRRVCGWTGLSMPALLAACSQAYQTTLSDMGISVRLCERPLGNSQVCGLCFRPRQYCRNAASSFGLSRTSRSLRPLPPITWITIRSESMSVIFTRVSSERRRPVAYSVISTILCSGLRAELISRVTSSWLSTVGSFCGRLG